LTFDFCDAVINGVWGLIVDAMPGETCPDVVYDVYDAFDQGEFYHRDEEDPVQAFTKPMTARIVSGVDDRVHKRLIGSSDVS